MRRAFANAWVALALAALASPAGAVSYRALPGAGVTVPGVPGATFTTLAPVHLNRTGQVLYAGSIAGAGVSAANDQGIWVEGLGGLELVAREGDPTGRVAGEVFASLSPQAVGDGGEVVFFDSTGLWTKEGGSLALVAQRGGEAPGTGGASFRRFDDLAVNASGQVTFEARLELGPAATSADDAGVWSNGAGTLELLAREGSPAPASGGVAYGDDFFLSNMTDAGAAGFQASPFGPLGPALWSTRGGAVAPVAREDDPAPGAGTATFASFRGLWQNAAGAAAFGAVLVGDDVVAGDLFDPGNDFGVWSDADGALALVAREGELAPTGDGALYDFGDVAGAPRINASGQIAFVVTLFLEDGDSTLGVMGSDGMGGLTLMVRSGSEHPGLPEGTSASFLPVFLMNDLGDVVVDAMVVLDGSGHHAVLYARANGERGTIGPGTVIDGKVASSVSTTAVGSETGIGFLSDAGVLVSVAFEDGTSGRYLVSLPEPGLLALLLLSGARVAWGATGRRARSPR